MAEFLSEFNVKHVFMTPSVLKKLTDAVFAVNTARQSATQESQFLLVYGHEPNAPADNLFPCFSCEAGVNQSFCATSG